MQETNKFPVHPEENDLRMDRMPHIWCSGCGLGMIVSAYMKGVKKAGIPVKDAAVVSGIGCTGRVAGYVKFRSKNFVGTDSVIASFIPSKDVIFA